MYKELENLDQLLDLIKHGNRRLNVHKSNVKTAISIDSVRLANKWRHDAMITELAVNRLKQRYNKAIKALTPFTLAVIEDVEDEDEEFSTCCGAPIIYGDICTQCKEHV
jgi:hypothetical protein